MCLIIVADSARPSDTELVEADLSNSDGMGIAYRVAGNPLVQYRKGLSLATLQSLAKQVELPYILHFRLATHGGITPGLCHPFPITRNVGTRTEGEARSLLFHNGVWSDHAKFTKAAHLRGPISDTRIMAYVLHREGHDERKGIATQIAQQAGKLAIFNDTTITRYGSWVTGGKAQDTTEGCYYSNDHHLYDETGFFGYNYSHLQCGTTTSYWGGASTPSPRKVQRQRWKWWGTSDPTPPVYVGVCKGCDLTMTADDEADQKVDGVTVCKDCWDLFAPRVTYTPVTEEDSR